MRKQKRRKEEEEGSISISQYQLRKKMLRNWVTLLKGRTSQSERKKINQSHIHLVQTESDIVTIKSERVELSVQEVLLESGGDGGLQEEKREKNRVTNMRDWGENGGRTGVGSGR